jgi:hypothetical protein
MCTKRAYKSLNQAVRATTQRGMVIKAAYRCPACGRWHITRNRGGSSVLL